VVGPRSYTPVAEDGSRGAEQSTTLIEPAPALGALGRLSDDSRLTFGGGVWNTFGGKVSFTKTGMPAFDTVEDTATEAVGAAALKISDRLSIGGALRLGIGRFELDATAKPFDAHLSASGAGVAMAWGALFRPVDRVRIAVAWRSPLRISTTGSGTTTMPGTTMTTQDAVEHRQVWPQQATLGVGFAATPAWKLAAQLDWSQWSQIDKLEVKLSPDPTQTYLEYWRDSWTARLGAEYQVNPDVGIRAGAYVDTAAVPDRTMERQYFDALKFGVAAGGSASIAAWRLDVAVDVVLPGSRAVPNNDAATATFLADRNVAPGDYSGALVTFELGVAYRF